MGVSVFRGKSFSSKRRKKANEQNNSRTLQENIEMKFDFVNANSRGVLCIYVVKFHTFSSRPSSFAFIFSRLNEHFLSIG